ncbi:unnamed protein product [Rotaria socialis]|uniref:Uncharacterized protein n=2 Tax=Rotaria socialis TaxID=392032 RepID=A0A820PNW6_9BILA|nr:unnamed protein product [Rotaria socialis]CAF3435202.1 unnamed protein product [Rotaria socialis]CAF3531259.1 unnamed protein product [Rotaria socialis]CAF3715098.1 unnamed protein product [Rotaria socialis]CAF4409342.1 unnamed protein product [Rotaria socialis]
MTSENELDALKLMETIANNEEPNSLTIVAEQTAIAKTEDEKINIEKPKRPGRKRKELTSTSSVKEENLDNSNIADTQPLFEQPIIVEGKRSRKPTSRLELSDLETPKKELSIPQGLGKPLGHIEYINYQITHASADTLSRMRNICFGRRASHNDIKQNLREFNGFEFEHDSDEYQRHLNSLIKLKKDQLRSVSDILGLSATSRNDEHAEAILDFLMKPVDEGKTIPERPTLTRNAKKASTNSKQSIPTDEDDFDEKTENGDDDDQDELFYDDEQEEDDDTGADDDYIGSDEEVGFNTKDDPDDFVYQPGKKTPKKKPPMKRSRKGTTNKRKKGGSTPSKRARKKTKITIGDKSENADIVSDPVVPMQLNNAGNGTSTAFSSAETKTDNVNTIDTKLSEQNDITIKTTTTYFQQQSKP